MMSRWKWVGGWKIMVRYDTGMHLMHKHLKRLRGLAQRSGKRLLWATSGPWGFDGEIQIGVWLDTFPFGEVRWMR
jgi:hypothetical protein